MANKYWIGGSGIWADISHWSLTSGGSAISETLGSTIITNGTFTGNMTGWEAYGSANFTYNSNNVIAATSNWCGLRQSITTVIGTTYKLSITVSGIASNLGYLEVDADSTTIITYCPTNRTFYGYFIATSTTTVISLETYSGSNNLYDAIIVDNVIVQEVTSSGRIPSISDNVILDSSSGLSGGTLILNFSASCTNFTSTVGASFTLDMTGTALSPIGSIVLESGLHDVASLVELSFDWEGSTAETITFNGCVPYIFRVQGTATGSMTFMDNAHILDHFYCENGTVDFNDKNITTKYIHIYGETGFSEPIIMLGNGIIDLEYSTGSPRFWRIYGDYPSPVTIVPEGSTIRVTGTGTTAQRFIGGDKNYNIVEIKGTSSLGIEFWDNNNFNTLTIDGSTIKKLLFNDGNTNTITNFNLTGGTLISPVTFESLTPETRYTLSQPSGIVSLDYMNITDAEVTGGAIWNMGIHSVSSNVKGWSKFLDIDFGEDYGKVAKGAKFNGISSRIILKDSEKGGDSMSISIWVYMNSYGSGITTLYSESHDKNANIEVLTDGILRLSIKTSTTSYTTYDSVPGVIKLGQYNHIVRIYNNITGEFKGYVNEILVINQTISGTQSYTNTVTDENVLGYYSFKNGIDTNFLDGYIDEVGIWSKYLSVGEINQLYNTGDALPYPFNIVSFNARVLRVYFGNQGIMFRPGKGISVTRPVSKNIIGLNDKTYPKSSSRGSKYIIDMDDKSIL